jgi:hypothetical protein
MPVAIKRVYLGNEICKALISSRRAVVVPPMVDDIAEALTWILWEAPQPIVCSYAAIIINLYDVCTFGNTSIHIREAHFKLTMMAMHCVLYCYFPHTQHADAITMLGYHLCHQWGERIHLVGFTELLWDSYEFLRDVSSSNTLDYSLCFLSKLSLHIYLFLFVSKILYVRLY